MALHAEAVSPLGNPAGGGKVKVKVRVRGKVKGKGNEGGGNGGVRGRPPTLFEPLDRLGAVSLSNGLRRGSSRGGAAGVVASGR